MVEEIKQRWFLPEYNLIVTDDMRVLTADLRVCVEEVHQGQLKFRIPGTAVRVSRRFIRKHCVVVNRVLQDFCPF